MENNFKKNNCSCIVPFYNEGDRVIHVLDILTQVKNLSEVIAIDGGSTDNAAHEIKKRFRTVNLVQLKQSQGKSAAVLAGLRQVNTEYTMLFDADIYDFTANAIEGIISTILHDPSIDMLILRRVHEPWYFRLTRGELVLSGERILRTADLWDIFKQNPRGYQLEIAINHYMQLKNKAVYWMPYSGRNVLKGEKIGIMNGLRNEINMYKNVASFVGYGKYLENLLFFCRQQYPHSR